MSRKKRDRKPKHSPRTSPPPVAPSRDAKAQREQRKAEAARIIAAHEDAREQERQAQEELQAIAREEAAEFQQQCREAAAERCKAISRAVGSVVASLDADEQKVQAAAQAYADAVAALNERHGQVVTLAAESEALADHFGVAPAKIPEVRAPDRRERTIEAARLVEGVGYSRGYGSPPATETCEHGLRRRRSFGEIEGTPGHEIIMRAGLQPFPPLNDRQKQMVADRERHGDGERSLKELAPFAQQTVAEAALSGRSIR